MKYVIILLLSLVSNTCASQQHSLEYARISTHYTSQLNSNCAQQGFKLGDVADLPIEHLCFSVIDTIIIIEGVLGKEFQDSYETVLISQGNFKAEELCPIPTDVVLDSLTGRFELKADPNKSDVVYFQALGYVNRIYQLSLIDN